jgi:hypothetical protein
MVCAGGIKQESDLNQATCLNRFVIDWYLFIQTRHALLSKKRKTWQVFNNQFEAKQYDCKECEAASCR